MAKNEEHKNDHAMIYQIRVEGHLSSMWQDEFEDWTITRSDDGETLFTGTIIDQSVLYGLLKRIRNLGIPLVEVKRVTGSESDQA